jgi:hypothetical protein
MTGNREWQEHCTLISCPAYNIDTDENRTFLPTRSARGWQARVCAAFGLGLTKAVVDDDGSIVALQPRALVEGEDGEKWSGY